MQHTRFRGLCFGLVFLAAALTGGRAMAQDVAPPSMSRIVPVKGAGSLVGESFFTRLDRALKFEVRGVTRGATVRVYAGDAVVAEVVAKKAVAVLNATPALDDGVFALSASQSVGGVESARAPFLSLVVDRVAPAAAPAPDLSAESDTGPSNTDNATSATRLVFTGAGEAGATAQLLAAGRVVKGALATVGAGGTYSIVVAKAGAGTKLYSVSLTDAAGNASPAGSALEVSVFTKAPKPPGALALHEMDQLGPNGARVTGNLSPTIVGAGLPGSVVTLRAGGAEVGTSGVDAGGFWAITVNQELNYGAQFFTATQTDLVGKTSKASKPLLVTIALDNAAPAPGSEGAALVDDFNDNSRHIRWRALQTAESVVAVREEDSRLELRMNRQNGARAIAGFFGDNWLLDMTQDFRIRVNWRMPSGRVANGEVAIALGLMMDGSTTTGAVHDGVHQIVGVGPGGGYVGHWARFDGANGPAAVVSRSARVGTFYMWYVAADDRLRLSTKSFSDPSPTVLHGVRSSGGASAASVFLAGWSDGNAPAVSGSDAHFDNFVIETGVILTGRVPSEGGTDTPVQADDFANNQRDPIWRELRRNSQFAEAKERNGRLEIDIATNPGFVDGLGGYFANGWRVDLTQDFRMRVDARFPAAGFANLPGNVGLTFALALEADTQTGQVNEGLIWSIGSTRNGPYTAYTVRRGGALVDSGTETRTATLQGLYLRYDAMANRLYFSPDGYNDANARFVPGLRTSTKTTATVFLGGFTVGNAPGVGPGNAYFDNFSVDKGALVSVATSVEEAISEDAASAGDAADGMLLDDATRSPDLNGDGFIDAADVAVLTGQIGSRGAGLRADLDGDGAVTVEDLRLLLPRVGGR